jgi:hypothetical protein
VQSEFHFSPDNLHSDTYLGKYMDSRGFVPLRFIANFKRVQLLTQDIDLLRSICMGPDNFDIDFGDFVPRCPGVFRLGLKSGFSKSSLGERSNEWRKQRSQ